MAASIAPFGGPAWQGPSGLVASARAAEWSIAPSLNARVERTDNYRLTPINEQAVTAYTVTPSAKFSSRTEISDLSFEAGITSRTLRGDIDQHRTDALVNVGASTRTERSAYGVQGQYRRDSTLATELTETGVVTSFAQRDYYSVTPSFRRALTERVSWLLSGGGQYARYGSTGANGLVDHDTYSARTGLAYAWSERTTLTGTIGWSQFTTDPFVNRTRSLLGLVSAEHRYSETLRFDASAGVYRAHSEVNQVFACLIPVSVNGVPATVAAPNNVCLASGIALTPLRATTTSDDTGYVYGLGLRWDASPVDTLSLSARRQLTPSGIGALLDATGVQAAFSRQLTERLAATVDGSYVRSRQVATSATTTHQTFTTIGGQLSWRFLENLWLDGGVRRRQVQYENNASGDAAATLVFAAVRYDWPRLAVSR